VRCSRSRRDPRAYVENATVNGEVVRIDGTIHVRLHYHLVSPAPSLHGMFLLSSLMQNLNIAHAGAGARASEMSSAGGSGADGEQLLKARVQDRGQHHDALFCLYRDWKR
jgi:hypothetical protein